MDIQVQQKMPEQRPLLKANFKIALALAWGKIFGYFYN
jgi:hypothetical protein